MKINSNWIKDLNVKPETVKLLEENIREKLHDADVSHHFPFLDMTAKVQATQRK